MVNIVGPGAARRARGRRITRVLLRPFPDGRGGRAYDPVIYLDNGGALLFLTQETESGEYGVNVIYQPPAADPKGT